MNVQLSQLSQMLKKPVAKPQPQSAELLFAGIKAKAPLQSDTVRFSGCCG